jgi:cell division protein FtsQ
MPTKTTSRKPLLLALVLLVVLGGLGGVGWRWLSGVTVSEVAVAGAEHAVPDSLVALAGVTVGDTLVHVDPVIAADRVRRHPWVETASVRRLPTGTVLITVDERVPVALALERGRPSHYLDRHGYGLPRVDGAAYDVPVLHGLRDAYHPVTPVQDSLARSAYSMPSPPSTPRRTPSCPTSSCAAARPGSTPCRQARAAASRSAWARTTSRPSCGG